MAETRRRRHIPDDPFAPQSAPVTGAQPADLSPEEASVRDVNELPIRSAEQKAPPRIDEELLTASEPVVRPAASSDQTADEFESMLDRLTTEEQGGQPAPPRPPAKKAPVQSEEPAPEEPPASSEEPEPVSTAPEDTIPAADPVPAQVTDQKFEEPDPDPTDVVVTISGEDEAVEEFVIGDEPPAMLDEPEDLASNTALWQTLEAVQEDEITPPVFGDEEEPPEPEPQQTASVTPAKRKKEALPVAEEEPAEPQTEIDDAQIERAKALHEGAAVDLKGYDEDDEDDEETADEQDPAVHDAHVELGHGFTPKVYVASRQAIFEGPNTVSLTSAVYQEEEDELNHILGSMAELSVGQTGFIRLSLRSWPEFKDQSRAWLAARRTGQDPDAKQSLGKSAWSWVHYLGRLLWFHGNKSSRYIGGSAPPIRPGSGAGVQPLRAADASDDEKQAWRDAEQKARDSAHFEAVLRVGVMGAPDDKEDIERICDELASGFEIYQTPHQRLSWVPADPYDAAIGFMGVNRPKDQPVMALSSLEAASMAHVPDDTSRPHGVLIARSRFKELPMANPQIVPDPYNPPKGIIPIGITRPGSEDAAVLGMANSLLDKHLYICGTTGSGKTELTKWFSFGIAKADYPLVVIDPHGALSEDLLNMFVINCPERIRDLVLCDLSDSDYPVALNPLDISRRDQVEPTVGSIMEMLASQLQLSSSGAPRAVIFAQQALTALCWANLAINDPEAKCTLLHVVTFFTDPEFRHMVVQLCDNVAVREAFNPETGPFEQLSERQQTEYSMPIVRAFAKLGSSDSFSAVFSAGQNRLDFGHLISQNKLTIVKLARFSNQADLGEFVGGLILPWLLSSMDHWGRKKDPETGEFQGRGCRLLVDEAPALFGPQSSVPQTLAESRKWDLGAILVSQAINMFDKSIMDALLTNANSKISLNMEVNSARVIAAAIAGGTSTVSAGDFAALPNFHFYGDILQGEVPNVSHSGPFSAACLPPIESKLTEEHKVLREQVRVRSRELVCNSKEVIMAKQARAVENIKGLLGEALRERLSQGSDPLDGHVPGSIDSMAFDADDGSGAWPGWSKV